jgi:Na+-driven multidrug efflux pump
MILQIMGALYNVANTIFIAKSVGESGMSAVSFCLNFDDLAQRFGYFLQVVASADISALIWGSLLDEVAQVYSDLLLISVLCGICLPFAKSVVRQSQARRRPSSSGGAASARIS